MKRSCYNNVVEKLECIMKRSGRHLLLGKSEFPLFFDSLLFPYPDCKFPGGMGSIFFNCEMLFLNLVNSLTATCFPLLLFTYCFRGESLEVVRREMKTGILSELGFHASCSSSRAQTFLF